MTEATTMAVAFADAKPAAISKIRRITCYSEKNGFVSFGIYFSNDAFVNKKFKPIVISPDQILIEEALDGNVVRDNNGSVAVQMRLKGIRPFVNQNDINISPATGHGKISFAIKLQYLEEYPEYPETLQSTPSRTPRKNTLHDLLNQIRRIERDTDYKLERSEDGTLSFVARIK